MYKISLHFKKSTERKIKLLLIMNNLKNGHKLEMKCNTSAFSN